MTLVATLLPLPTYIFPLVKVVEIIEIALLLALAWPILQGTFFIITPDAPMLFFWTATLFACYTAVFENRPRWWYLAGILAGFAMLSKYIGVLIFPGIFLFLIGALYRK